MIRKNKKNQFPIFICLFSFALLALGFYYEYVANPKRILGKALNNISTNITQITNMSQFSTGLASNYTQVSNIKITANTNNYTPTINNNKKLITNYPIFIKNLNDLDTKVIKSIDTNNHKKFFSITSSLNGENLFEIKRLIENSTEYYYVSNYLNTYINNGNNNYFESLDSNTTTYENTEYLKKFLIKSIANNLDNTYFNSTVKEKTINNISKKYNVITLNIDNDKAKKLTKLVLNDVKNDPRAYKIFISYNPNFKNVKINKNTIIIPKNTDIKLNIYTDRYTYKIKKYELIKEKNNNNMVLTYEYNDENFGNGYVIRNNNIEYKYEYLSKKNSKQLTILTENDKKLGTINIEKTNTGIIFDLSIVTKEKELAINYIYNILNLKKNQSYDSEQQLTFRSTNENQEILNMDITINSKTSSKVKIEEDASDAVIERTLSKEEKETLNETIINTFNILNS